MCFYYHCGSSAQLLALAAAVALCVDYITNLRVSLMGTLTTTFFHVFLARPLNRAEKGGGRSETTVANQTAGCRVWPRRAPRGHHGNRFTSGANGVRPA